MKHWSEQALCAQIDPELFFPEKGAGSANARQICAKCAVKVECLTEALKDTTLTGIWGGTSEKERRLLRRAA